MIISDVDHKVFRAFGPNIPRFISEKVELSPFGVCVPKETFGSAIVMSIKYLVEGGIPQHLFHLFFDFELMPILDEIPGPSVFSLNDLVFGFVVWLISCAISIIAFFSEVFYYHVKNLYNKLIYNFAFLIALLRFIANVRYSGCH